MKKREMVIKSKVLRYVVPFFFERENGQYDKICDYLKCCGEKDLPELGLPQKGRWTEKEFWETKKEKQSEMDVYSYLLTLFKRKGDEENALDTIGTSFVFRGIENFDKLIYSYKAGAEERQVEFHFVDLCIILLKNGTGFVWYEIDIDSPVNTAVFLDFQYKFKELSRTNRKFFFKKNDSSEKEYFFAGKWLSTILSSKKMCISFWGAEKG